jgi:diaminopimelate epimerase
MTGAPMDADRAFFKMTGSGNDFVFFDARRTGAHPLEDAEAIAALCARGTGVGADGVVFLVPSASADVGIRYYNSDGSRAAMCGNATLCTVRLAGVLGIVSGAGEMRIETPAGVVAGRMLPSGEPEFDMAGIDGVRGDTGIPLASGERAIGFAVAGNPHLVVWVAGALDDVDVLGRGRELRHHASLGAPGANVNFVGARGTLDGAAWGMRTYERGVEGETLACGTGSVASAALLAQWGAVPVAAPVQLWTRSGLPVSVRLRALGSDRWGASLAGEGRLVYRGELAGP